MQCYVYAVKFLKSNGDWTQWVTFSTEDKRRTYTETACEWHKYEDVRFSTFIHI